MPDRSSPTKRIFVSYARSHGLPVAQALRDALRVVGFDAVGDWLLTPGAELERGARRLPDLSVFQRWAPSLCRLSYLLSPLNDPGGRDRRDGRP